MELFFLVLVLMLLLVAGMAIGILMGRKPISGSCGGMSALGMEVACDICGGDKAKCDKENDQVASSNAGSDLAYDASSR